MLQKSLFSNNFLMDSGVLQKNEGNRNNKNHRDV